MSKIICVSNRKLCNENFLIRIEKICKCKPDAIILREKDMEESEYEKLAIKVNEICTTYGVPCYLHSFCQTAIKLGVNNIHLPLSILEQTDSMLLKAFNHIGTSCHSVEDVKKAQQLGCTYAIAGHIFETDCKKGLEPRGISFLEDVCKNSAIPIFAIGGITKDNIGQINKTGTNGVCIMSGMMTCSNPEIMMAELKHSSVW